MPKRSAEEEKLHSILERLEEAKQTLAELKGERRQVLQQLADLGAESPEQAKKLLRKTEKEIEEGQKELSRIVDRLESEFGW